jgi:hypothetical protein
MASGLEQLWPRTFARIETNEDVVAAISANTLEVGPPPAEEREQHVARFDRRLRKANGRLVVTNRRCAEAESLRCSVARVAGSRRPVRDSVWVATPANSTLW